MKLRSGWKSLGKYWRYKENDNGIEAVVQFVKHGQKRYEAHCWQNKCCGFANSCSDL